MTNYWFAVFLLFVLYLKYTEGIQIVGHSNSTFIKEAGSYSLFCETDVPYRLCAWTNVQIDKNCFVFDNQVQNKEGEPCSISNSSTRSIIWTNLTSTKCGITIQNASLLDVGDYKCDVSVFTPQSSHDSATTNIDIARSASVSIHRRFSRSKTIEDSQNHQVVVECGVIKGNPEAVIKATIVSDKDDIEPVILDEVLLFNRNTFDSDQSTVKHFTFNSQTTHCEKYLQCEAVQKDQAGEILFQNHDLMPQKICSIVNFTEGDAEVEVNFTFSADTNPNDGQLTWYINPIGNELHSVSSGNSSEDGYLTASSLQTSNNANHEIQASLVVKNTSLIDLNQLHYVELETTQISQQYGFFFVKRDNPCNANPCKNGGTCTLVIEDKLQCTCKPGFVGHRCESNNANHQNGPQNETTQWRLVERENADNESTANTGTEVVALVFFIFGFVILVVGISALLYLRRK